MNPVLRNNRTKSVYAAIVALAAAMYAIFFGLVGQGAGWAVAADFIISAGVFSLLGLALWSVIKFAVPRGEMGPIRLFILAATGLLTVTVTVGAETLTAYVVDRTAFTDFAVSIPLRVLFVAMAYVIVVQYLWAEVAPDDDASDEVSASPSALVSSAAEGSIKRISVRSGAKIKVITPEQIEYLQAEGDYVAIVTHEGRWLKEQTMKHFEQNLPAEMFVRVHRSYLVGLESIVRIERYGKLYQVILRSGEKIKVSAGGYKLLKEKLNL